MGSNTLRNLVLFLALLIVIAFIGFGFVNKSTTPAGGLSKGDVESIVKEYIEKNPETIIKSLTDYQQKAQADQEVNAQKNVAEHKEALENNPSSPIVGNPEGDVTIVEFFDYSCGYCKRVFPTVMKLIEEDKNIKVVFKEFPILGPTSLLASQAAIAVHLTQPEKYLDFHKALMEQHFSDKASIIQLAESVGVKTEGLSEKMDSAEVKKIIDEDRDLAAKIGVRGTPAFTINGEFIPGAIDHNTFVEKIKAARSKQ